MKIFVIKSINGPIVPKSNLLTQILRENPTNERIQTLTERQPEKESRLMSMKKCFECGEPVCTHEKWKLANPDDKVGTCDDCGEPAIHFTVPVKDNKIVEGSEQYDSREPICRKCLKEHLKPQKKVRQWNLIKNDGTIDELGPNLDAIDLSMAGGNSLYHEVCQNPQRFIKK